MKVELLPSTVGLTAARQFSISALINDTIAIDAGTIGLLWPMERQMQVRHVFLSHGHIDHVGSLPIFLDNIYSPGPGCPIIYACEDTEKCLRNDIFNDRLWPDFFRISQEESPFFDLQSLQSEVTVELPTLNVTPVRLDHVVPTMGFILQDPECSVAFVSDSGPTKRIWEVLATAKNLRAVFLECSFPNSHRWLAEKSGHLCTDFFEQSLSQFPEEVAVIAYHLKPQFFDEIKEELNAIGRKHLAVGIPGTEYRF